MTRERRFHGAPAVIPAHPGFRAASFGTSTDDVTESTRPEDLVAYFTPVIAWIVEPRMLQRHPDLRDAEVDGAVTTPVGPEGDISESSYLVDPDGRWSLPFVQTFECEEAARRDWIDRALLERTTQAAIERGWREILTRYVEDPARPWDQKRGPKPGQAGCRVPAHLLREFKDRFDAVA